ncbi:sensor histidine kinase [Cryptosporangium sp. NPDC051539]|uniref:sensor histidine kinase n=1 Tax=Cryptosporangium sp. NPDC051539 TaxID=3363962 RepID=UPI0037BC99B5
MRTVPVGNFRWAARSAAVVVVSYVGGLVLLFDVLRHGPVDAWLAADVTIGAVACLLLLGRHRIPLTVGFTLAGLAAIVASAGVANMVALYFVARYRALRTAVVLGVTNVLSGCVFWLLYPGNEGIVLTLTVNVAIAAAATAWGALVQSQHTLLTAYRERAERAEEERDLREERIRANERTRIAREMHDVVAHRVSLVALCAGGLEVARGRDEEEIAAAAALIRASALQALDEMRTVIGLLREDGPGPPEQPGLNRLNDLVDEARRAGQQVVLEVDPTLTVAEGAVGRDVYRIVQEGLTNARKHAPGETVRVSVNRTGQQLAVDVVNRCATASLGVPGSGNGLIGLTERTTLAGGSLTHGGTAVGEFELRARLPWP